MRILLRPKRRQIRAGVGILLGAILLSAASMYVSQNRELVEIELPAAVLIQIRNQENAAVHSGIVLTDRWVWLSPNLLIRPEPQPLNLRASANSLDVTAAAKAMSETYELKDLESWVVDMVAIAALVDLVESVEVTPGSDMVLTSEGQSVMVLKAGSPIRLGGKAAGIYALTSPQAFEQVWKEVMKKLDMAYLPSVLPAIGAASRSSLDLTELIVLVEKLQASSNQPGYKFVEWSGEPKLIAGEVFDVFSPVEIAALQQAGLSKSDS